MIFGRLRHVGAVVGVLSLIAVVVTAYALPAFAADTDTPSNFSLQISPSPLITNVRPGSQTELELKIRNAGNGTEKLKIEPRSFKLSPTGGNVQINDTTPPDIASWISFSAPKFTVQPGEVFAEKVRLNVPKDTGFSYSFVLIISRQDQPKPTEGGRLIQGSVAVFTLVNVDRPGASRQLDLATLSVTKHVYEYLPAKLDMTFHNSGNTIVQPFGTIFIQRGSTSKQPLATLTVNDQKGYILPGTSRSLSSSWDDGFPAYKTVTKPDGSTKQKLTWNWSKLSSFRLGRYTAKVVAVYDDGNGHDVPIQGEVSFWVFPWKILLGLLLVGLLILFGLYSLVRKIIHLVRRITGRTKPKPTAPPAEPKA